MTDMVSGRREGRAGLTITLGGGGAPGLAYMLGALRALDDVEGLDIREADHMIGTSAGSLVAAGLRLDMTWEQISDLNGSDTLNPLSPPPEPRYQRAWTSPADLARRAVGSSWAVSRALVRIPLPPPPRSIQRMFPSALLVHTDPAWTLHTFGETWPGRPLCVVTVDLDSGRRVVLHNPRRAGQTGTLDRCLRASCAVPAIYAPVRVGTRRLVDGGVHSANSFDLAARTNARLAICVAPMAVRRSGARRNASLTQRAYFNGQLAREAAAVRRTGADTIMIMPNSDELVLQGRNRLRSAWPGRITEAAYESTRRYLDEPSVRAALERFVGRPAAP
jgi:NTE family protein